MSTMYDALKKAEAEHKKTAVPGATTSTGSDKGGGMPENTKTIILLIAVLVVFGIVFIRIKGLMGETKKPVAVPIAVNVPKPVVVPVDKPLPPPYVLNGVIDAGKNSAAIINNKLLKYDDTIDDLILKKISPQAVELLNTKDNSTVILKLN